jgi:P2-related tail formation protein
MIKLYDSNITDILPPNISDPEKTAALGYAIHKGTQRMLDYSRNISLYAIIDILPDDIVDMLALDLNTQYYDTSLDINTKRELVKNTPMWYKNAGTPRAVEELVRTVFGDGDVKEWFEYGGDPYYFKIITSADLTEESESQFNSMIQRVKNTRSHLETIDFLREIENNLYFGTAVVSTSRSHVSWNDN